MLVNTSLTRFKLHKPNIEKYSLAVGWRGIDKQPRLALLIQHYNLSTLVLTLPKIQPCGKPSCFRMIYPKKTAMGGNIQQSINYRSCHTSSQGTSVPPSLKLTNDWKYNIKQAQTNFIVYNCLSILKKHVFRITTYFYSLSSTKARK